jgi:hypothetical protein
MPNAENTATDLERGVLRALCSASATASSRASALNNLADYTWGDHECRVVFDALRRLRGRELEEVRACLPAAATRMGFPDVNWDSFFGLDSEITADPEFVVEELLTAASKRQQP